MEYQSMYSGYFSAMATLCEASLQGSSHPHIIPKCLMNEQMIVSPKQISNKAFPNTESLFWFNY